MSQTEIHLPQRARLGETSRRDAWWSAPLLTFLGLGAFVVYATWAAAQGAHYFYDAGGQHYLSPMYSPVLWDPPGMHSGHAWFGQAPQWLLNLWPTAVIPFTPAFLILWAPGGFRFTCYYYRGAYYKAFWGDPVSCAVGEPGWRGTRYRGERKFPLVLQNVHRYFLYLAILFIFILGYDAVMSYVFTVEDPATGERSTTLGMGLGSIVLTINPILLGLYTFGCHSLRHLIGGRFDALSRHPGRQRAYGCVSCLNRRHMLWAWLSLFWVALTDVYVRVCSMGIIEDPVLFRL